METRLAIVETMAQQNLVNQQTLVADVRGLRSEIGTLFAELRSEVSTLRLAPRRAAVHYPPPGRPD
jgi:hypothetical protein